MSEIPQAAGITGILTAAGLGAAEVHAWFGQPRRELAGLAPAAVLAVRELIPGSSAGRVLLELAQADARNLRRERQIEREDADDRDRAQADWQAQQRDEARNERETELERGSRMQAEPVRYAGLIYHAVREAGHNPLVAGFRAARILRRELWCMAIGHDWKWTRAHEIGESRRVCDRCLRTEPRKGADRHA